MKGYKNSTKLKQSFGQAKSSTYGRSTYQDAELHGKDDILKALLRYSPSKQSNNKKISEAESM